jgi:hypothetical protein
MGVAAVIRIGLDDVLLAVCVVAGVALAIWGPPFLAFVAFAAPAFVWLLRAVLR